jgi:hypothetical protein
MYDSASDFFWNSIWNRKIFQNFFLWVSIAETHNFPMFKLISAHTCMNCVYLRENSEVSIMANCGWCNTAFWVESQELLCSILLIEGKFAALINSLKIGSTCFSSHALCTKSPKFVIFCVFRHFSTCKTRNIDWVFYWMLCTDFTKVADPDLQRSALFCEAVSESVLELIRIIL